MWKSSCTLLKQSISAASRHNPPPPCLSTVARASPSYFSGAGLDDERSIHTPIDTHMYRERMWNKLPPLPRLSSAAGELAGGEYESSIRRQTDTCTDRYIYRERMRRSPSSCTLASSARVPPPARGFSSSSAGAGGGGEEEKRISLGEARKLMRLVNVEALKKKLGTEGNEVIGYPELLEACVGMGVAKSRDEAVAFVRVLDDAAVVMVFRDKVYLHPDKVVDLVRKAVPLALTPEDDPRREELKSLIDKKEELDKLAYKQVRRILWTGLGFGILQTGLFFRLTFWEFSWDVMEPIAFFTTATGIVVGYAYFLFTSRDPTYQDFMQRLFLSRQRKLIKKYNFDFDRYMDLQKKCKCPLDGHKVSNHQVGVDVGHDSHDDAFH